MSTFDKNIPAHQLAELESQIREVRNQYEADTSNTVTRNLLAIKLLRLHEKKLALLRPDDSEQSQKSENILES